MVKLEPGNKVALFKIQTLGQKLPRVNSEGVAILKSMPLGSEVTSPNGDTVDGGMNQTKGSVGIHEENKEPGNDLDTESR